MSQSPSLEANRIEASQGRLLKELRCRALLDAPHAFSATLEEAQRRTDEEWETSARHLASDARSTTFIAYNGETPCGMMGCHLLNNNDKVSNLVAVWVAPECRRMRVGHALLEAIKQWSGKQGAKVLSAWVAEKNTGAIAFYLSLGFQATQQRQSFPPDASQQQTLLTLEL